VHVGNQLVTHLRSTSRQDSTRGLRDVHVGGAAAARLHGHVHPPLPRPVPVQPGPLVQAGTHVMWHLARWLGVDMLIERVHHGL
jgi:hypothetical protein